MASVASVDCEAEIKERWCGEGESSAEGRGDAGRWPGKDSPESSGSPSASKDRSSDSGVAIDDVVGLCGGGSTTPAGMCVRGEARREEMPFREQCVETWCDHKRRTRI